MKRSAHTTVSLADRYLLVFGGWAEREELGDLHQFDIGMLTHMVKHILFGTFCSSN